MKQLTISRIFAFAFVLALIFSAIASPLLAETSSSGSSSESESVAETLSDEAAEEEEEYTIEVTYPDWTPADLTYEYDTETLTATVTGTAYETSLIEIPETVFNIDDENTYTVTSIADYAFISTSALVVYIPDTVTAIGEGAFYSSSVLDIYFSGTLESIGAYAFYNCSNLYAVTIPESVTSIGAYAFYSCIELEEIILEGEMPALGENAFDTARATKLILNSSAFDSTEYSIFTFENEDSEEVSAYADHTLLLLIYPGDGETCTVTFEYDEKITPVSVASGSVIKLPDSGFSLTGYIISGWSTEEDSDDAEYYTGNTLTVTSDLTLYAFWDIDPDVDVSGYFGGTVTIDGIKYSYTFGVVSATIVGYDADSIGTSVTIPNTFTVSISSYTVKYMDGYAFSGCTTLTSIDFSSATSLTYINNNAFEGCTSLKTVTLGSAITTIYAYAFYGCTALTSITIPDTVTEIEDECFVGCTSLKTISFGSGISSIGDYTFKNCTALASLTIPSNVIDIGSYAFQNCTGLTSLAIYSSTIGNYAFYKCTSLASLTLSSNVTSIGGRAFAYCTSLTSITIPSAVTSIDTWAFYGCSKLTSVTFNHTSSLPTISSYAFNTTTTTYVTLQDTIYSAGDYTSSFSYNESTTTLYFLSASGQSTITVSGITYSVASGSTTAKVTGYTSAISASASIASSITINSTSYSVTVIDDSAFKNCTTITSVTIPTTVTTICSNAFYYCTALAKVTFASASSVKTIESDAFYYCTALTSITIPDSVTTLGSDAFAHCTSLITATIGSGVTELTGFYYCTSLRTVTYDSTVTSIGSAAFSGCTSLESFTIQSSIDSIGTAAFYGCSNLTSVTFNHTSSLPTLGTNSFDTRTTTYITLTETLYNKGTYTSAFSNAYSSSSTTLVFEDPNPTTTTTHYVSFNRNGGLSSTTVETLSGTSGTTITLPSTGFTRTGYTQTGWLLGSTDGTHYDLGASYKITGNVTFYAEWTANTYTVTLNGNGGTTSSGATTVEISGTYGSTISFANYSSTFTNGDKTLLGWALNSTTTSPTYSTTSSTVFTSYTIKYYAIWGDAEYTVTFYNGSSVYTTATVTAGESVNLDELDGTFDSSTGVYKLFTGWATSSGTVYTGSISVRKDINLYAQWTEYFTATWDGLTVTLDFSNGVTTYGGTTGTYTTAVTWDSTDEDSGKATYTFEHTYTSAGSKTIKIESSNIATNYTAEITLTLTSSGSGGGGDSGSYTITYNASLSSSVETKTSTSSFTPASASDFSWAFAGYEFSGWASVKDGTVNYTAGNTYTISSDLSLYAVWVTEGTSSETYTVTYYTNGASGSNYKVTVDANTTITLLTSAPSGWTYSGYSLTGWALGSASGSIYSVGADYTVQADTSFYAQWADSSTVSGYTVTFNTGGGSTVSSQTIVTGGTVSKPDDPTYTGYKFAGWYTSSNYNTRYTFTESVTGSMTLYAKWVASTVATYTVSFTNLKGEIPSQTVGNGDTAAKPVDPTMDGYTFKGWYTDSALTKAYDFSAGVYSDITLYAKWSAGEEDTELDTTVVIVAAVMIVAVIGVIFRAK